MPGSQSLSQIGSLVIFLGVAFVASVPNAQPNAIAELIVKFSPESEFQEQLASLRSPVFADEEAIAFFSDQLGPPLEIKALTSGHEVILAIDREALASLVATDFAKRDDVQSVTVDPATIRDDGPFAAPRLTVTFEPQSPLALTLAQTSQERGEHHLLLMIKDDTTAEGWQLRAALVAIGESRATLVLDVMNLTDRLAARLDQHTDVVYVQRNIIVEPFAEDGEKPFVPMGPKVRF